VPSGEFAEPGDHLLNALHDRRCSSRVILGNVGKYFVDLDKRGFGEATVMNGSD
jgi:hypothetical protein